MSEYIIYKVNMTETKQPRAFAEPFVAGREQECFGSLFKGEKSLKLHKRQNKDMEDVINDIYLTNGDVCVLRINKVMALRIVKPTTDADNNVDYEEGIEESYPFSYVIIDNRPGICQIAIEKTTAWHGQTVGIRDILEDYFNDAMSNYSIDVTIDAKMNPKLFWEHINHMVNVKGKRVTSVTIGFQRRSKTNCDDPRIIRSSYVKKMLDVINYEITNLGAVRNAHSIFGGRVCGIRFEETNKDMANIVNLCCNNAYTLKVKFSDKSLYKCNEVVKASYNFEREDIEDFRKEKFNTDLFGENKLIAWLDNILEDTKNYECEKERPGKKSRKK